MPASFPTSSFYLPRCQLTAWFKMTCDSRGPVPLSPAAAHPKLPCQHQPLEWLILSSSPMKMGYQMIPLSIYWIHLQSIEPHCFLTKYMISMWWLVSQPPRTNMKKDIDPKTRGDQSAFWSPASTPASRVFRGALGPKRALGVSEGPRDAERTNNWLESVL